MKRSEPQRIEAAESAAAKPDEPAQEVAVEPSAGGAPRRSGPQDARIAALRRSLASERSRLRHVSRALEAANAEVKLARRRVSEAEDRSIAEIASLRHRIGVLEGERARLAAQLAALRRSVAHSPASTTGEPAIGGVEERSGELLPPVVTPQAGSDGVAATPATGTKHEAAVAAGLGFGDPTRLSSRWRELHEAYRGAVAEFDELRTRRDRLQQSIGGTASRGPLLAAGAAVAAGGAQRRTNAVRDPVRAAAVPAASGHIDIVVHLEEDDGLRQVVRDWTNEHGGRYSSGPGAGPLRVDRRALVVANLLSEKFDFWQIAPAMAGSGGSLRAILYGYRDSVGRLIGEADVFPSPFDADSCAVHLLREYPGILRVLAVGDALESMSRLRDILGRYHCSTAVAFDARQALDLLSPVRPRFVLVDLAIAKGAGFDLLARLYRRNDREFELGAMWSRPLDGDAVRCFLRARQGTDDFGGRHLRAALAARLMERGGNRRLL